MTMKRRGALIVALGLALTGGLFGFAVPAQALSITGTYTQVAAGTPGTGGGCCGIDTGLVGPIGTPLASGFPDVSFGLGTNFWSTATAGVTTDAGIGAGTGVRVDNASGVNLSFPNNFYVSGATDNETAFRAVHWTAQFSNPGAVTFSLASDDHAFLFIDGVLALDNGGVKAVGDAQSPALNYNVAGNHTLDLFFADVLRVQSGIIFSCDGCADPSSTVPEPATLVLFGSTLVGLGTVVRRRFKGSKQAS